MRVTPLSPYVMSCVGGAVKFRIVSRDGAVFNINVFDVKDDDIGKKFEEKKTALFKFKYVQLFVKFVC